MRSRIGAFALAAVGALVLSTPALAGVVNYTGQISTFTGGGNGVPVTATPLVGTPGTTNFTAGNFTLPAGMFVTNVNTPVGFTANAAPNSIYTIAQITNQSSLAGSFGPNQGFGGGFGGTLGSGTKVTVLLGIVPLPNVFGSVILPVNVGVTGSVTAMASVLGNAVNVTVTAKNWTTGMISGSDGETGSMASSFTATGTNNLTANGGSVTLVTPFKVIISGAQNEIRVGYAKLELTFTGGSVPEPGTLLLLGAGVVGLAAIGRRKHA